MVLVSCYEPGYQPLAVASPAAFLTQAGYAPLCLDLAVEDLETVGMERLRQARLVAISVPMHTATVLGLRVAERVRAVNPAAHLCFYGLYAHLNQALLLRAPPGGGPPLADTVMGPECEEALVTLANSVVRQLPAAPARPAVPGRTAVVTTPTGTTGAHLHRLPFLPPRREGLPPLERYARLLVGNERRITGYVETTRGCLYLCRHCPIPPYYDGRFFAVPADLVVNDIGRQVEAGARHIVFGDPDFLNSAKHALAIVHRMHAAHPQVTFSFTAKVEHIIKHRQLFPELASLGGVFMVSAVESLSDQVLRILDKRHTRKDVYAALTIVRGAGMSLRPTFVAFTPWTTLDDYLELCELIASHYLEDEVDPVQLAIRLLIPPGSLLLDQPELKPFLTGEPFDERSLTHAWRHPDARMDRLCEAVSAVAEEATRVDEEPAITFARIHDLAAAMDGRTLAAAQRGLSPARQAGRVAPARLSEPWFCCAQPTRSQLASSSSSPPPRSQLGETARPGEIVLPSE
ncbi:MAG: CUAEP/CCAEP-tail radical SAM protein [Myxococcales bacterium]